MGNLQKVSCKWLKMGYRYFWIEWKCFLEVDVQYPGNFHNLHKNLPFFPEKMEIKKVGKLEANLHDKGEYVIYKRNLKKSIKPWISIEKSA